MPYNNTGKKAKKMLSGEILLMETFSTCLSQVPDPLFSFSNLHSVYLSIYFILLPVVHLRLGATIVH